MDGRVVVEEGKLDWCRPSPADSAASGRSGHEPSYSVAGDTAQAFGVDLELSRWSGLGPVALCPKAERCCPESSACGRAKQAKGGSLRRAGIFVGLAIAEGCKGSGHRDAGDTAMTRVSVWGDWAKLCCTPRLWEALSAVSTEEAGWQGARHNGPPRQVAASACTLWPSTCACACACVRAPYPWLELGRQCMQCRPSEVVPASQDEPITWCGCARQASEGPLIQSPSRFLRKVYPASHT